MKRALLSQIKNDWRENIWLVIELLIVALIIWWLTLGLLRVYKDSHIPLGADITNVYKAQINILEDSLKGDASENVMSEQNRNEIYVRALQSLLDRVRDLPMVEAAALGNNPLPYNYNNIGREIRYKQGKDTIGFIVNVRTITPEGIKVLKPKSKNGLSLDNLQKILEKGEIIVGPSYSMEMLAKDDSIVLNDIIGRDLVNSSDKVGDIIDCIRRNDYEINFESGTLIQPVAEGTEYTLYLNELIVRVKPGKGKDFEKAMLTDPALISPTLISLSDLRDVKVDKQLTTWSNAVECRTYSMVIIILLAIVFIGVLGSFWYRVYLRTPEIAVRKTFGASDIDILRRFLSEAFLLLTIALILGLGVCLGLMDYLKNDILQYIVSFNTWKWDMVIAGLITASIMALMIFIGVAIPGWRAMRIEPAIALKEE
ncbi:MAG: FtsX-like permease family protein [Muribaculaceae bacterium]|nr:FtsX-like permease family protein [Muribaculaceae bacterium]